MPILGPAQTIGPSAPAMSISGAVRRVLSAAFPTLRTYRDGTWVGDATPPYLVVQEGISITPERPGDDGDPWSGRTVDEQVQITICHRARENLGNGKWGKSLEDPMLADRVWRALIGSQLPAAPTQVIALQHRSTVRLPIAENRVNHIITISVRRLLA
jgi:hypothetical protein